MQSNCFWRLHPQPNSLFVSRVKRAWANLPMKNLGITSPVVAPLAGGFIPCHHAGRRGRVCDPHGVQLETAGLRDDFRDQHEAVRDLCIGDALRAGLCGFTEPRHLLVHAPSAGIWRHPLWADHPGRGALCAAYQ
eukprot:1637301-Pleurochrysis_carterae.AAC.1